MARADIYTHNYKKEERYSDFLMSFEKNPQSGNLGRVTNEQSIKQSLISLIMTNRGERFYDVNIGSKVKASLNRSTPPALFASLLELLSLAFH